MKKLSLAVIGLTMIASPVMAADLCKPVPEAEWMSKETITAKLVKMGYEVRKVQKEDGCWELKGKKKGKMV